MSSGFTGPGGGGGGGGGGGAGGGGGGGLYGDEKVRKYGVLGFLGVGHEERVEAPQFLKGNYLRTVPTYTPERYADPHQRVLVIGEAARQWLSDPKTHKRAGWVAAANEAVRLADEMLAYLASVARIATFRASPEGIARAEEILEQRPGTGASLAAARTLARAAGTTLVGRDPRARAVARARATRPPSVPIDAETVERIERGKQAAKLGGSIHDFVLAIRRGGETLKSLRAIERRARRAGGNGVSIADTLNTVLGVGATAYSQYTQQKIAESQAKAAIAQARAMAGLGVGAPALQIPAYTNGGGGIVPAAYEPGVSTAVGVPPQVLAAIQRFLSSGGAAGLGAGLGAGVATLLTPSAPTMGGGGPMILRPGDSVDSLYATRTASSAPSFFATQDASGRLRWYRSAGRPILWSGDLAACRRVNKVAARARARLGGRRSLRRRR